MLHFQAINTEKTGINSPQLKQIFAELQGIHDGMIRNHFEVQESGNKIQHSIFECPEQKYLPVDEKSDNKDAASSPQTKVKQEPTLESLKKTLENAKHILFRQEY